MGMSQGRGNNGTPFLVPTLSVSPASFPSCPRSHVVPSPLPRLHPVPSPLPRPLSSFLIEGTAWEQGEGTGWERRKGRGDNRNEVGERGQHRNEERG